MELATCPWCGKLLSERSLYCSQCAKQVRCKSCRAVLERDAVACDMCGTLVGEETADGAADVSLPSRREAAPPNTFEYEETDKRRSFKAQVSDDAMANMNSTIGLLLSVGVRGLRERPGPMATSRAASAQQLALPEVTIEVPLQDAVDQDGTAGVKTGVEGDNLPPQPTASESDRQRLHRIFRYDADRLVLDETRLKQSNKADFYRRLTYLFLYAHYLEGRERIPRDALHAVLKDADVLDPNCRHWVNSSPDLDTQDNQITLRAAGRDRAKEILAQLDDPSVVGTWSLASSSHGRTGKNAAKSEEAEDEGGPGRRKGSGRPSNAGKWVKAWNQLGLPVNGHEVLRDRSNLERAIFGLWAIRRAVGDDGKLVGAKSLSAFILEAFEYKVYDRSLVRDLTSGEAKDLVLNRQGTSFQITQTGMQSAERLAGLDKPATSAGVSANGAASPATST